jgi:hypothetical protein
MIRKLDLFRSIATRASKARRRKTRAQSMVEFAILLPLLIMLFSGMVEFGFMMNTYLSLLDATRQSARHYSNLTPFILNPLTSLIEDDPNFYSGAALEVKDALAPPADPSARQIVLDTSNDDVLISVISVSVDTAPDPDVISLIERHPTGYVFFSLYGNQSSNYQLDSEIEALMIQNGTIPVETGILIVEVWYGYHGVLKLPWLEMFMSDASPVMLHADTIMPLVSAKP